VVGTYTLRQIRANGTGGTYEDDTPNSPSCGYVSPTYSFTSSVTNVDENNSFTITLNTNQSGSFPYTITGVGSADIGGASLTGSLINGQVLTFNVTADAKTETTETFTITLDNGLATKSVTINDTSKYPASGTYITQYCSGFNLYYTYADGSGGTYDTLQQSNSATCGYVAPSYSLSNTISGDLSNGGGFNFYHNSSNANGTSVTVSKSGTGSSYITISPTTFTVSGSSENKLISVTSSTRPAGTQQQSVTISTNTGQSFSFTLEAVPGVAPLVSTVTYSSSQTTYYNGETLTAFINMNGPIIAGTYVRVAVWLNGSEAGYNIFTAGQTIPGVTGEFPTGTSAGYYSVSNPGLNATVQIKAKAVSSGGVDRQAYVNGPTRSLSSAAPR
jgi:hypothetical protein